MAYKTGEEAIYELVVDCDGFGIGNVSQADWKILNQGKGRHFAILRIAGGEFEWQSMSAYRASWRTALELWQRYEDEYETQTKLYANLDNLLSGLMSKRHIDTTVNALDFAISEIGEVEEMWTSGGGPAFLRLIVMLDWSELTEVTFS
jgi:hypothetical protein